MSEEKKPIFSIVLLLRQPRQLDLAAVQRAVEFAYRGAPEPPKVVEIKKIPGFGILLGPLRLAVINADRPYFRDIAKAADRTGDMRGKLAIQQHTAWLSVDIAGEPPPMPPETMYKIIGKLIAEFIQDDVLGLIRRPDGPIIGYDFSFIPLLRMGRASEVFQRGAPDRVIKAKANDAELAAATAEARQRWSEFLAAFAKRYPQQGFAVKKAFVEDGRVEHMWVSVVSIEGPIIRGWLSNTPGMVKSLKFGDAVELSDTEVEDWMYTDGKQNVGSFQANVLRKDP